MTLKLTLKKNWFDLMISGEKTSEFRVPGRWIESRLFDKNGLPRQYDYVEFTNGYGSDKPRFRCLFEGFDLVTTVDQTYSNGTFVQGGPFYEIRLGQVLID